MLINVATTSQQTSFKSCMQIISRGGDFEMSVYKLNI